MTAFNVFFFFFLPFWLYWLLLIQSRMALWCCSVHLFITRFTLGTLFPNYYCDLTLWPDTTVRSQEQLEHLPSCTLTIDKTDLYPHNSANWNLQVEANLWQERIFILRRSKGFDKSCHMKFYNNSLWWLLLKIWWKDQDFSKLGALYWSGAWQSQFDISLPSIVASATPPLPTFQRDRQGSASKLYLTDPV